jgi:hypothetical protein
MRTVLFSLAAAAACTAATIATPAFADEARADIHGGLVWAGGNSEGTAGIAAGYDWDLGSSAFAGIEGSADKVLVDGSDVYFGLSGRVGAKVGSKGKAYALAGYTFGEGEDSPHAGLGYEHMLGGKVYGKVEYRHYFIDDFKDLNAAVVGVGIRF